MVIIHPEIVRAHAGARPSTHEQQSAHSSPDFADSGEAAVVMLYRTASTGQVEPLAGTHECIDSFSFS